jgi:hypothetical protein
VLMMWTVAPVEASRGGRSAIGEAVQMLPPIDAPLRISEGSVHTRRIRLPQVERKAGKSE